MVLVAPRNPLNIGAVARAMSNFGLGHLRLVRPYDLAFREARSAVRAAHVLEGAEVFDSLSQAVSDCDLIAGTTSVGHRELHIPLRRLEAAAFEIRQQNRPVALLFGSEKFGLGNEDLSFCRFAVRIPTREAHGSMNLGQAAAICLYELARDEFASTTAYSDPDLVGSEELERFTALLVSVLQHSGYTQEAHEASSALKLRRLVRRLRIPAADARTWLGILRQIQWKVTRGGEERGGGSQ